MPSLGRYDPKFEACMPKQTWVLDYQKYRTVDDSMKEGLAPPEHLEGELVGCEKHVAKHSYYNAKAQKKEA